jgi:hypothetical protein
MLKLENYRILNMLKIHNNIKHYVFPVSKINFFGVVEGQRFTIYKLTVFHNRVL